MKEFEFIEVTHVPREHNARADILSKLASTRATSGNKTVIQEVLTEPSVQRHKSHTNEVNEIIQVEDWRSPIIRYITNGELPSDPTLSTKIRRKSASFTLIDGTLYKRGFHVPLIKCLGQTEGQDALVETHEGICGQHLGAKALAKKVIRAGFFWPTILRDAKEYVSRCDKCQKFADMHIAPPAELTSLTSPWPFAWWGIDLLGPFPKATGQLKYLVVAVDYFTKWIEAEPLAKITAGNVLRFFKRNILARFGIPALLISDNGTQFTDRKFQDYLERLNIKHSFTSVEHPQANGQAESANRVLLRGIRRRLDGAKTKWVEELYTVLWAYRTTPHSSTGETPFRLTYGSEAVIPIEMNDLNWRTGADTNFRANATNLREELDFVDEIREHATLREAALKQKIAARHNKKVIKREFDVGDLVLRRNQKDSEEGKLAANWDGPYRIYMKTGTGAYGLEDLVKGPLPRTWNAEKLKRYYS